MTTRRCQLQTRLTSAGLRPGVQTRYSVLSTYHRVQLPKHTRLAQTLVAASAIPHKSLGALDLTNHPLPSRTPNTAYTSGAP